MSAHTITITLKDGHAIPEPNKEVLALGDTVSYVTYPPNLPFVVKFDGASPFSTSPLIIKDSTALTVSERGTFFSQCFLTVDGQTIGWHPGEVPESGGEHDVRP